MSRITITNKNDFRQMILHMRDRLAYVEKVSSAKARILLLEQLGIQPDSKSTYFEVWTQNSRLKELHTVDEQHFSTLAWLGFQIYQHDGNWLSAFLQTADIALEQPLNHLSNHNLLLHLFRKARLNGVPPSEREIGELLITIFGEPSTNTIKREELTNNFHINGVYTDEDNHLYVELCGTSQAPLIFRVKNERTKQTWQALGSQLTGTCKPYRAIYQISSAKTWYTIEMMCLHTDYGARIRCFTSDKPPYFCADIRIDPPHDGFVSQIDLPAE